jgi:hypothetical protein
MVATDVASRGIGMIEPPSPLPPSSNVRSLPSGPFLSLLRRYLACVTLPGLFRVFRFSIRRNLGIVVQQFFATLVIPCLRRLVGVPSAEWAFLDSLKLSPRLLFQRGPGCVDLPPRHGIVMDSPCPMQRESIGCTIMYPSHAMKPDHVAIPHLCSC